jgi:phosphoglucosamine mutase
VRGVANTELTPELALALGRAVARVMGVNRFLTGRDTRRSGPLLQAALAAGLASEGVAVSDAGVIPTPGLAWLSARESVPAAMISASHNLFSDNGIKIFSSGGTKLGASVEAAIEAEWSSVLSQGPFSLAGGRRRMEGAEVGSIEGDEGAVSAYVEHLVASLEGRRLDGLSVVVDCAHGAATAVAPVALRRLGAHVSVIAASPDGININASCGSTHPDQLREVVVTLGADAGLAFDGDADRCLAVDHTGALVDGDHLLALFAVDQRDRGRLDGGAVAVTVMSNLGFRRAMERVGIGVEVTPVGDRHVLEAMEAKGLALGGEQSGHIIFRRLATTGDGILTGLQLLDLMARRGQRLVTLTGEAMSRLPQHLASVAVAPGSLARLAEAGVVWSEVAAIEAELGSTGRVLLRPSGTEPVVRVMAEASSHDLAVAVVSRLCEVVHRELGNGSAGAQPG